VEYTRDDSNISSNSNLENIIQIYSSCEFCNPVPTPTPSTTSTPTNTPTSTAAITPSVTATQTATPSQTATNGTTPPPTPTQTRTPTATNTPTPSITASPSATPNFLYVYQSCNAIGIGGSIIQVIQTQPVSFTIEVNEVFKDTEGNCWYFVGQFNTSYIAPPRVTPINFGGNYFTGVSSQVFSDCVTCATAPDVVCVTGLNQGEDYQGSGLYQIAFGLTLNTSLTDVITATIQIPVFEGGGGITPITQTVFISEGNTFVQEEDIYQNSSGANDTTFGDACVVDVSYNGPETLIIINECGQSVLECPTTTQF
jgi:hypothetical protein